MRRCRVISTPPIVVGATWLLCLGASVGCGVDDTYPLGHDPNADISPETATNAANPAGPGTSAGAAVPCQCGDRSGVQARRSDGSLGCCQCPGPDDAERFICLQQGMLGTWQGTMHCPWWPQTEVRLVFRPEGTYVSSTAGGRSAFYWGDNGGGDDRHYALQDLLANGQGMGRLRIIDDRRNSMWGELRLVEVSEDQEQLRFEFWNTWGSNRIRPLVFDLHRVP